MCKSHLLPLPLTARPTHSTTPLLTQPLLYSLNNWPRLPIMQVRRLWGNTSASPPLAHLTPEQQQKQQQVAAAVAGKSAGDQARLLLELLT